MSKWILRHICRFAAYIEGFIVSIASLGLLCYLLSLIVDSTQDFLKSMTSDQQPTGPLLVLASLTLWLTYQAISVLGLVSRFSFELIYRLYAGTILVCIRYVYIYSWGFWRGKPLHEICADLTNVPAELWKVNTSACQERIDKELAALNIVLAGLVLVPLIVRYVNYLAGKYCSMLLHSPVNQK